MVGAVEGAWPSQSTQRDAERSAEELRVFYVAVTRAKDQLVVCCPGTMMQSRGKTLPPVETPVRPTRYLKPIL